jgi:hypothetical protein
MGACSLYTQILPLGSGLEVHPGRALSQLTNYHWGHTTASAEAAQHKYSGYDTYLSRCHSLK